MLLEGRIRKNRLEAKRSENRGSLVGELQREIQRSSIASDLVKLASTVKCLPKLAIREDVAPTVDKHRCRLPEQTQRRFHLPSSDSTVVSAPMHVQGGSCVAIANTTK
jgi:hypothetical protein